VEVLCRVPKFRRTKSWWELLVLACIET
jgi:hypothetical protein